MNKRKKTFKRPIFIFLLMYLLAWSVYILYSNPSLPETEFFLKILQIIPNALQFVLNVVLTTFQSILNVVLNALQFVLNGIIAGSIYALIAFGFTIIYRTVKFFHFAHGVVYTAGAYLAYTLTIFLGLNSIFCFFLPPFWPELLV